MKTILLTTILMSLTGYIVAKLGQKHTILFTALIPMMLVIDALTIYLQYNTNNKAIMTGVMIGTLSKIIIFLNNESN